MTQTQAPIYTPNYSTADRILRPVAAAERLGISKTTFYDRQNPKSRFHDPNFPKPISLGVNMKGYLESEINAYIQHLAKSRG